MPPLRCDTKKAQEQCIILNEWASLTAGGDIVTSVAWFAWDFSSSIEVSHSEETLRAKQTWATVTIWDDLLSIPPPFPPVNSNTNRPFD